ncbi:tetratricopeptide repeat protein, partial [Streptomyces sp. NPDC014991]|uniref:tetratricopeptide repeat protein n=1 Tax=Streptomyces sp. NPDC014991 TaxID=3364935 RepID=UPI0036FDC325
MQFSFRLRSVTCRSVLSTDDSPWGRQDGIRVVLIAYSANGYHDFLISGREFPEPDLVENYVFVPGKSLNLDNFPPVGRPDWTLKPVPFGESADVVKIAVVGINEGLPFAGGGGGFNSVTHEGFKQLTEQLAEKASLGITAAVGLEVAFELLKTALEGLNGPDCRGVAFVYQTDLSLKKLLQDHLHRKSITHVLGTANGNQALGIVSNVGVPAGCGRPSYEAALQATREEPLSLDVQDRASEPRAGDSVEFLPSVKLCRPAEPIFVRPTLFDREITLIPSFHYPSLKPMWRIEDEEVTTDQGVMELQVEVQRPGNEHVTNGKVTVGHRREEVGGIERLILSTTGDDGNYLLSVGLFLNFEGNIPPPPTPFVEFDHAFVSVEGFRITGNAAYDQYLSCVEHLGKVFAKLWPQRPKLAIGLEPVNPIAELRRFEDAVLSVGRVFNGETTLDQLQAGVDAFEANRLVSQISLVEGRHNLIARLIDEDRIEEAVSLVAETVAGYRQYARLAGADGMQVGRYLAELAALLTRARRTAEAVNTLQALMDVYGAF